jgi:hypothetical protein
VPDSAYEWNVNQVRIVHVCACVCACLVSAISKSHRATQGSVQLPVDNKTDHELTIAVRVREIARSAVRAT